MTHDHEAEHVRQIYARQAEAEAKEPRAKTALELIRGPAPAAAGAALNQRIIRRYEEIRAAVNAPNTDTRIFAKVARALEEQRIPEGEIAQILACIHMANNRGAYFVAAVKKCFSRNHLDWHTENWQ